MTRPFLIVLVLAAAPLLGGCQFSGAALGSYETSLGQALEQIERFNNANAGALKRGPCASSFGAVLRTYSPRERAAAAILCGGDDGGELPP